MKVKTLIKKLEELDDEYQDAEVTIQHPIYNKTFMPIKYDIKTNYCINRATKKADVIVVLKMDLN